MPSDASAYAALGLEAGAAPEDVDRAYKALIKRYHPDRAGGDATRAVEINRAYRHLREQRVGRHGLLFNDDPFELHARRGRKALAAVAVLALVLAAGSAARLATNPADAALPPVLDSQAPGAPAGFSSAMDEPLTEAVVDQAVAEAVRVARAEDEVALTSISRACHQAMRAEPSLAKLDRCAAFDDAVAMLQDRDPLRDQGPFSELAVTGRQMSGATLLSNDYLAIDSRLDRIRLRVELALAPAMPAQDETPPG